MINILFLKDQSSLENDGMEIGQNGGGLINWGATAEVSHGLGQWDSC